MVEAEQTHTNGQFKLHLNSNLIQTDSSTLPDELRNLGVCAYDEQTFEKGLLHQMDRQIAEYNNDSSDSDEDTAAVEVSSKQNGLKRKIAPVNNTDNSKKARTNTDGPQSSENMNLEEFDDELNGISYSPLIDEGNNDSNIEQMIKNGEMTPFGTVVNFEKSSIRDQTAKKSETTTTKSKSKIVIHKLNQLNDFDTFLTDLDKKQKPKPVKKKPKETVLHWSFFITIQQKKNKVFVKINLRKKKLRNHQFIKVQTALTLTFFSMVLTSQSQKRPKS